jgi:transposase
VFSDGGEKRRHETMEAGHRMELVEAIRKAKDKFDLSSEAKVVSCYEAGRDGFWLHRYLVTLGVDNQVVDSSSIETNPAEATGEEGPHRRGQAADDADALLGW